MLSAQKIPATDCKSIVHISLTLLPLINAGLNLLSTCFIVMGWFLIKNHHKKAHACCMITALITSALFLSCYLYYHYHIPGHHVTFTAQGWPRFIYFFILLTHLPLAFLILPLIVMTLLPALRGIFEKHRRIAKVTLPIWLYVSITGVLIYLMLYVWFPHQA